MNRLINSLLLLLMSPLVLADNFLDNTYTGFSLISQDVEIEISSTGANSSLTDSGTGFGIYLEKYLQKKYRINGMFSYVAYDDFDIYELTANADYLLPVATEVTLFGGAAFGLAMQKYSNSDWGDAGVAPVYGVQLGAIFYAAENLMLEAGYRFRPTSIETDIENPANTTTRVEDLSESYVSAVIMF